MRRARVCVAAILGALSAAPTPGDIGGCGREPTLLDVQAFAEARKDEDCRRCSECEIETERCARSCDPDAFPLIEVPQTCRPLRRDGEVCLRALRAASCDSFASYVRDDAPTTPTECQFCKIGPGGPEGTFGDGGGP